MGSLRQGTHFQCRLVGSFTSPGIDTRLKGTTYFSGSSERYIHTQSLMLGARLLHVKYNMPGPGIEPRPAACQADVLPTTLPRLSCTRHMSTSKIKYLYSSHEYFQDKVRVLVT